MARSYKNILKNGKACFSMATLNFDLAAEGNGPPANNMSITSGIAYQKLLKTIVKSPTAQRLLNNSLGINSAVWTKVYMLPRQVAIELPLRSF